MIKWLDGLILNPAQWTCDKIQVVTGVTKFSVNKWLLIVAMLFVGTTILLHQRVDLLLPLAIIIGIVIWFVRRIEEDDRRFQKSGALCQPYFGPLGRLLLVVYEGYGVFQPLLFSDLAGGILIVACACIVLSAYANACIPRPPSKSKLREWSENVLWWLSDLMQPALKPATIRK